METFNDKLELDGDLLDEYEAIQAAEEDIDEDELLSDEEFQDLLKEILG